MIATADVVSPMENLQSYCHNEGRTAGAYSANWKGPAAAESRVMLAVEYRVTMPPLPTSLVGRACRIFMDLAYPAGPSSIPVKRLVYYDFPADRPLIDFFPPASLSAGIVQSIGGDDGEVHGYALRLGSAGFPHLKLRVQEVHHCGSKMWVFMVDTHDAFSKENRVPPADHPDAAHWLALQDSNRRLKEGIEAAWVEQGLATCNSLLRQDLQ